MRSKEEIERLKLGLERDLGRLILDALNDKKVFEIILNSDGNLWIDGIGGMINIGRIEPMNAYNIIMEVSGILGQETHYSRPILEGEFPLGGRFEALIPPVVANPSFTIRKFASFIFPLDYYIESKAMTEEQKDAVVKSVLQRKNILVAGSTGSGKTTLSNAIIACIPEEDRIVTIEDTNELQIKNPNWLPLRTSLDIDMVMLLKATMRLRPDRIIVGEVRDKSAYALLKAWNTGHPGGVATLHANSCEDALFRLNSLVEEAGVIGQQKLIARAVDLIIFIEKVQGGRIIKDIKYVKDYDGLNFILEDILEDDADDESNSNVIHIHNYS